MKRKRLKIGLLCILLMGSSGCFQNNETSTQNSLVAQQDTLSIESRSCNRITAILPDKGRYDGISMEYINEIKRWKLKFEHIPYRNEHPSPIGLLTMTEIAEITSLILNRNECANPPYASQSFETGDRFLISIDWWLVEDLYMTGLEATRLITKNYKGPMLTKPLSYKEVTVAFKEKGFLDSFCNAIDQPDYACVRIGCEYNEQKSCKPQWYSTQKPFFSASVKDIPMSDVCKVVNCGLEKESKFTLEVIKF